jgi:hypothetical protein
MKPGDNQKVLFKQNTALHLKCRTESDLRKRMHGRLCRVRVQGLFNT